MAGPPRPTPPSAFDGYRRLERTRRVVTERPVAAATATMPRSRPSRARLAGALRLAAFVAVLAIIIGTSVGLASADPPPAEPPAAGQSSDWGLGRKQPGSASPAVQGPVLRAKPSAVSTPTDGTSSDAGYGEESGASNVADTVAAETAVAGSTAASAARPTPTTALPFTGTPSVDRLLIAGASLVLLGMLVQIAGQPLPARARARR